MDIAKQIVSEAMAFADADLAHQTKKYLQGFEGGYGYGDVFLGIKNPALRSLAKTFRKTETEQVLELITHEAHEIRLLALFILELQFDSKKTPQTSRTKITNFYYNNLDHINNWDLVDASAHKILGPAITLDNIYLLDELVHSHNLWKNRVAMMATFYHIKQNDFEIPLRIATKLVHHKHDLIHKAVGWMLREIGNRDMETETSFLKLHYKTMPRTMLRYAIEKFEETDRTAYLKGRI